MLLSMTTDIADEKTQGAEDADTSLRPAPLRPKHPMDILLKNMGVSFPKPGELAEGTAISKERGALFIDLGPRGTGVVYGREYKAAEDIIKHIQPGDRVSGKIVELAVRNVVHGEPVKNTDALANPQALAQFRDRPELA